jgi:hypothetical protein
VCLVSTTVAATATTPADVLFFDMDAAVATEQLGYPEQLVAFVFEGLVNEAGAVHPTVMFNAGYMNFDWPGSDLYWHGWLTEQERVAFANVSSATLCGLVAGADPHKRVKGMVLYDAAAEGGDAEEWVLPIAITVAAQQQLLPVSAAILSKHGCLADLPIGMDLTKVGALSQRDTAWAWAFQHLLPKASKTVAFNLYHYGNEIHSDPQSNATLANVDWAVQQNAFVMNFRTSGPAGPGRHRPAAMMINPLFSQALASMEPLFSMYGWADDESGLVWMTQSSGAAPDGTRNASAAGGGGAVFCSFATPNLSFWKLLALPGARTKAQALPVYDRGMKYVT